MGNLKTFGKNVVRGAHRVGLHVKKMSPEILIGVGIGGMITAAVMACRAMKKTAPIKEEFERKMDIIEKAAEEGGDRYPEESRKNDVVVTYVHTGIDYVIAFAPAVVTGALSIGCILGAHGIMKRRNAALGAAYMAVDQAFKKYRDRVIEELGAEMDRKFRYGLKAEEIEIVTKNDDGTETVEVKQAGGVDISEGSQYARFFDSASKYWEKSPSYNLMFLKQAQNWANDRLHARGHVFLNEVYDYLDIPHTRAGSVVGWLLGNGDDYIDFGIFDAHDTAKRRFVNGYENVVLLDFNVDGVIYDKI